MTVLYFDWVAANFQFMFSFSWNSFIVFNDTVYHQNNYNDLWVCCSYLWSQEKHSMMNKLSKLSQAFLVFYDLGIPAENNVTVELEQ